MASGAKVIPIQAEQLHVLDGQKLVHVYIQRSGNAVTIIAVTSNGSTLDEILEELQVCLAARHKSGVSLMTG